MANARTTQQSQHLPRSLTVSNGCRIWRKHDRNRTTFAASISAAESEAKPALDMVAAAVLTAYHVRRKRQTVQGDHHDASGSHTSPTLHQPMDGAEQARQFYGAGFDDMPDDLRG